MPRLKASRLERSRMIERILDATEQLAVEVGVDGMTLVQIARRARMAVGTLYNYFPNGKGILTTLLDRRTSQLLPLVVEAATATRALPFDKRLRAFVTQLIATYRSRAAFMYVAVQLERRSPRRRDTRLSDATAHAFEAIMRDGARNKRIAPHHARTYARMIHGALRAMFVWGPASEIDADTIVDTFLYGMT